MGDGCWWWSVSAVGLVCSLSACLAFNAEVSAFHGAGVRRPLGHNQWRDTEYRALRCLPRRSNLTNCRLAASLESLDHAETFIFGILVHLPHTYARFGCQGHWIKLKVTGLKQVGHTRYTCLRVVHFRLKDNLVYLFY